MSNLASKNNVFMKRTLIKISTFLGIIIFFLPVSCSMGNTENYNINQLRKERKEVAFKQRRIIVNNDGNEEPNLPVTPESFLKCRTLGLEKTQVDSIFYCTGVYNYYSHDSKVSQVFDNVKYSQIKSNNWCQELIRQGTDSLEIMTNWCRQNNREIFWSMRMNDTHDTGGYTYLLSEWKKEHPEYLMGKLGDYFPVGDLRWTALNYECQGVRDKTIDILTDVCSRYDVDGIEMDFFRHPIYFMSVMQGGEATQQQCELMTDMMRQIRRMTEEIGLRRKRPLLVAIRIPDSLGYCKAIGLHVDKWLKEGLVDIMSNSCYFRLEPWEKFVATGRKYQVPVYAALETRRLVAPKYYKNTTTKRGEEHMLLSDYIIETFRGEASNALKAGVNGIYLFNQFDTSSPLLNEIGDRKTLAGKKRRDSISYVQQMMYRPEVFLATANKYFKGTQTEDDPETVINENMKDQRHRKKFNYKRNLIYNNDGNESLTGQDVTPESFLAQRTSGLENTGVNSIFYCTGLTLAYTHNTKVAERYGYNGLGDEQKSFAAQLDKYGVDSLGLMINYARQNHKEIFWSMRMNDCHDSGNASLTTQWEKDHPECLMGRKGDTWPYGANSWSALNYAKKPVREHIFAIINEVCSNYDVDGIELDFFSHPVYFEEVMNGKKASKESLAQMTGLIRQIRKMTEDVSWNRGRPLLIAIRVPDSLDYCKAIGLDVETWLSEDYVDILTAGGDFKLNPWEELVKTGQKYRVPVYACNVERRIASEKESENTDFLIRRFRGEALAAWEAGVNGIYIFNLWYNPKSKYVNLFTEMGDSQLLKTLPHQAGAPPYQPDCRSKPQTWVTQGDSYIIN